MAASSLIPIAPNTISSSSSITNVFLLVSSSSSASSSLSLVSTRRPFPSLSIRRHGNSGCGGRGGFGLLCLPASSSASSSSSSPTPKTRLYVSGLSFRTTEEGLRNAFKNFGELVEVNLVMDKIANRPRGFAFLHYATEEESQKAIEGMHGKFLDGRVIFVEVAKPRSQARQGLKPNPKLY